MKCFECGCEIEDTYYKCLDNFMQVRYFVQKIVFVNFYH